MYNIGFTTGVFDVFHVGHLNLLEKCKAMCSHLIVAVCDDDYVRNVKHKEPVYPLEDRVRILAALKCVDEVVVINPEETRIRCFAKTNINLMFCFRETTGRERKDITKPNSNLRKSV